MKDKIKLFNSVFIAGILLPAWFATAQPESMFSSSRDIGETPRDSDVQKISGIVPDDNLSGEPDQQRCRIDYYFIPGCEQCRHIDEEILPQLQEMFGARIMIFKHNLFVQEEFSKMLAMQPELSIADGDSVFIVIDREIYIGGLKDISRNLLPVVEERLYSGRARAATIPGNTTELFQSKSKYFISFSWLILLTAGFIDGLNPCAFATIVFLISLLLTGRGRKEKLIMIGIGFCSAAYLTYFLIGLGFFQAFRLSLTRLWLGELIRRALILVLLVMAVVSFRDAYYFRLEDSWRDVILRLPERITRLIHRILRVNLPHRHLLAGSFILGVIVTVLESICTGQLYVPTLAFLARTSQFKIKAISLLALYNLMFIMPLVVIFIMAYFGTKYAAFAAWSKKDVFWAKCALGGFFIFLAVVLYLT